MNINIMLNGSIYDFYVPQAKPQNVNDFLENYF